MSAPTTTHGSPAEGLECMVMYEELDNTNYVEYQTAPSGAWHGALVSEAVVQRFLETQMEEYREHLRTSDCAATTRRLLTAGPPIWMLEKSGKAMPIPEGDTHICTLWYASDGLERPAKVVGALEGEARDRLIAENYSIYGAALDAKDDETEAESEGKKAKLTA